MTGFTGFTQILVNDFPVVPKLKFKFEAFDSERESNDLINNLKPL